MNDKYPAKKVMSLLVDTDSGTPLEALGVLRDLFQDDLRFTSPSERTSSHVPIRPRERKETCIAFIVINPVNHISINHHNQSDRSFVKCDMASFLSYGNPDSDEMNPILNFHLIPVHQ